MKKINVGCGKDIKLGYDNLDLHSENGANIVWDLNNLPLPFKTNTYDYVYCSHVIEDFADPIPLIKELIRICKVNGIIEIKVPNETMAWTNINHKHAFTLPSFRFMDLDDTYGKDSQVKILTLKYYVYNEKDAEKSPILNKINFNINCFFANLFGEYLMNTTFLKYIFPYLYIQVIYKKINKNQNYKVDICLVCKKKQELEYMCINGICQNCNRKRIQK
jgi:SAM-dependent methyltransferase